MFLPKIISVPLRDGRLVLPKAATPCPNRPGFAVAIRLSCTLRVPRRQRAVLQAKPCGCAASAAAAAVDGAGRIRMDQAGRDLDDIAALIAGLDPVAAAQYEEELVTTADQLPRAGRR